MKCAPFSKSSEGSIVCKRD